MSSYRKLKEKNKSLIDELFTIAEDKDSIEAQIIIKKYKMIKCMEYALWYGNMYEKTLKGLTDVR